jgi:hypothetical protein
MSTQKEANEILKRVKANNFNLLLHANERSKERSISKENVINCAKTCFHWEWQEEHRTHVFLGKLDDETTGGFTAVLRDEVLVVTVFKRRLSKWERDILKAKK